MFFFIVTFLFRGVYEEWLHVSTYEELEEEIKKGAVATFEEAFQGQSFRFKISAYGQHYSRERQREIMAKTNGLRLWKTSKVDLKNYQQTYGILSYVGENTPQTTPPTDVFLGRKLCSGARSIIDKFSLKKRVYIGTTSMNPELSILMANQALVLLYYYYYVS